MGKRVLHITMRVKNYMKFLHDQFSMFDLKNDNHSFYFEGVPS